jgi:hypothetical protein
MDILTLFQSHRSHGDEYGLDFLREAVLLCALQDAGDSRIT